MWHVALPLDALKERMLCGVGGPTVRTSFPIAVLEAVYIGFK